MTIMNCTMLYILKNLQPKCKGTNPRAIRNDLPHRPQVRNILFSLILISIDKCILMIYDIAVTLNIAH
jgi:hypothetical protein